jgi:hypothetical protein
MSEEGESPEPKPAVPWTLFFITLALGLAGTAYVLLKRQHLSDSAALYLGIPLILALTLSRTPKSKSALGAIMKGMTIALLLSAYIFQEGYICILFCSPIFYAVGALVALPIDYYRDRRGRNNLRTTAIAVIVAVLALEGTTDLTTVPRDNAVSVSKIVAAPASAIREQLGKPPRLDGAKPFFLRIFPYPVSVSGEMAKVGDERRTTFVAYKHIWWTRVEGVQVLRVTAAGQDGIEFAVISDDTYLSHYLAWQSSEVRLQPIDGDHTKVTWTLRYRRILDPAWYFGPLQRYAVRLTAEELIDRVATPGN